MKCNGTQPLPYQPVYKMPLHAQIVDQLWAKTTEGSNVLSLVPFAIVGNVLFMQFKRWTPHRVITLIDRI